MGDFFSVPSGLPEPPPEPDIQLPNFQTIGQTFGTGLGLSKALSGIWAGFLEACAAVATWLLAWILKMAISIAAWFIGVLTAAESDAGANYGQLVANTLQNVFGVTVSPSDVNTRGPSGQRQVVANKLAQSILGTMFSGAQPKPGGGLTPTDAPANAFLATTTNMALNGWLETWVTDALSLHELQRFGELKDIMARVLGLGRMSRQVFAPPIKVLVHDPYQALLNQKYRPKGLAENSIVKLFHMGKLGRNDLSTLLGNEGYSEQYIDYLIAEGAKPLSLADVDYLVSHGTWSAGEGLAYISTLGYDSQAANIVFTLEEERRIDKYRREIVDAAVGAFVKGDWQLVQLQTVLDGSGIAFDERPWIIQVALIKREVHIAHLSLGQIEEGILDGVLTLNDLRQWAIREGLGFTDEQILELEVLFKQNKQTAAAGIKAAAAKQKAEAAQQKLVAAAAKAAQANRLAPYKGISIGQAETLVTDGIWTFQQLTDFLTAKGDSPAAISGIVALLHAKMAKTASNSTAAAGVRAAAATKGLSLAEMERAVEAGHLSIADLQTYLSSHGFDAPDAQVILELVSDQIAAAKVKADAKAAAAAKAATKDISLADIDRAVRLGLTPIATYTGALTKAGFDQPAITLLVGILQAQIAKDAATAAKKTTAPAGAKTPAITLAQMEAEIVAGIRPIADYTTALATLGYTVMDQRDLTELLQAKVDNAKAAAAKKVAAGTSLANRGISLADAERAVKLGVVPIATYKAMLKAAGFTQDAIDVLSAVLLAEIAKTAKAQAATTTAATTAAGKGIALLDIERAVLAGIDPIATYTHALRSTGYSAADAATLTELVQLKLDHQAAVERTHADAEGKATDRGISIASEERAVLAGELTMANYDALLTSLGYDAVDRMVLEQLLLDKIEAAAAKDATPTPPDNGGATPSA